MPDLLLEVGCEELPASFVRRAGDDLRDLLIKRLGEASLSVQASEVMGTPRRLIVSLVGIAERQADEEKVLRGPSKQAAYDAEGKPSKALEGFCRGQGVDVSTAYVEGEYVWVRKQVTGRSTLEVLSEVIPDSITSLTFGKTMRWAGHRLRFARPIRWILASFGGALVPFSVEGVVSGLKSRGHRFNFPGEFESLTFDALVKGLREREVEPNGDLRVARISEGAHRVSGGRAVVEQELVEENAYLTEWPNAVLGTFDPLYMTLPEPVLTTVMAKHERFFPVREAAGSLTNEFVSIRNGGVDEVVAKGNAWVLNARFSDAKFFFDEDQKHTLDEFLEKTQGIVFQAELGTVRERADRLSRLCEEIARRTGADDEETEFARVAGLYAKADLSTGLVGELDELQGVIGGIYARREGFPDPVCWAIHSQYEPSKNPEPSCPGARTAIRLVMADQLDKLAGYLGLGLTPSGSSDPYGLRRAAGISMESALVWDDLNLAQLLSYAAAGYAKELKDPIPAAREVFKQRCETLFPDVRPDVLDAVLADAELVFQPAILKSRTLLMSELAEDVAFVQAATRPLNIVSAAEKKGYDAVALDVAKLDSAEGVALLEAARSSSQLKSLAGPINSFFEATMVMVEDPAVRDARLAMLREVCAVLLKVGDFSKLVIAG